MRTAGILLPAFLLVISALTPQVLTAEDLYWEGEEDAANEYLEVKDEFASLRGHLHRLKRGLFDFWDPFGSSSTTTTENYESVTEDRDVDAEVPHENDDEVDGEGSGRPERERETEPREKTLRVTFVVNQPYRTEYSNRDSLQFQTFSRSLADAVNLLFDSLPGTQRASLVRIQSRISDEFTCKVTLDIVTTGYEDTQRITDELRNNIRETRSLGTIVVSDADFSATVIDPGSNQPLEDCPESELRCNDGRCVSAAARCNGFQECADGSDEAGCPPGAGRTQDDCLDSELRCNDGRCVNAAARCNGVKECADGSDEAGCPPEWGSVFDQSNTDQNVDNGLGNGDNQPLPTLPPADPTSWLPWDTDAPVRGDNNAFDQDTTPRRDSFTTTPQPFRPATCADDELRCDETRCVPLIKRCDGYQDCYDRTDEAGCGESCGADDFRCNNGKCISGNRRCDRIVDCPEQEDEQNCVCTSEEFSCVSDRTCIELRKRCDGVSNCADNSDENDCGAPSCPPESFTCDPTSRILCAKKCDGIIECDGGEDENSCLDSSTCNHECDGRCLEDSKICDGTVDCRDGSDEQCYDCDGPSDFRCKSGECINAALKCNGVPECGDYSDELNCNGTMTPAPRGCTDSQFQCSDTQCIDNQFLCDGHPDCLDNSDEDYCPCDTDKWTCVSGQCIPDTARCDGTSDCYDGSDEVNCPTSRPWFTTTYPPYLPPATPRPNAPPTLRPYPTTARPFYTTTPSLYRPYQPPGGGSQGPVALNLKTYPDAQMVRNALYQVGGDVVFQCRDEGPQRVPVRWVREGGRPIKPGSTDKNGRLEITQVSMQDGGIYICQAVRYLGVPGSELRVQLSISNSQVTAKPPGVPVCTAYQATCGNGQCISKSAVCDGKIDCLDGSDEDACNSNGRCEPNQFQCANRKCVLKTWLCDSEDDCGDGSDEQNCGASDPRQLCLPVEFKCQSGTQCVPKSFHCDGQSDCFDGSDEIGCAPVYVTKPPAPANVRLNPGESLTLVCEAVGVPTPLISWRLNWGHVPDKCTATSVNGVGTLTCPNMQTGDSGAYSCEAINNKGTTFGAPDSIVYVNKTDVCPNGFFNNEARSENECIRCFCFGESTQCRSADLFTYDMATPLGEGGTRLVGIKQTYNGQVVVDSQPITDQYYYQPLRNGATVTKLANFGSPWQQNQNSAHPFLTLPETYNGNQLTSYGGHIKYRVAPHSPRYGADDNVPDIIIKGKYGTLVHKHAGDRSRESYIEVRFTAAPANWQKTGPDGVRIATREDIMMTLDNIEMILLRADSNNAGVNITDFAMESAQHINVGLGSANLVEECTCPPGYEGLSCQKCASGFVREKSGPWLGNCVRETRPCPPGTYGDPNSGLGCRPCPCPLTNRENQFARTCHLAPNGGVACDCAPGYGGQNCEYCEAGYIGNPMIPGDSCRPEPISNCNPIGTVRTILPDECLCKDNVQGRYCDLCKNDSFHLSADSRHGCSLCFCSGVSQDCTSSNLRRKTATVRFNTPQIVDQVRVYNSVLQGPQGVKYNTPVETELKPRLLRGELTLSEYDRSRPTIYYWSLPGIFAGDKVTAYGGYLRYVLRNVPVGSQLSKNNAADIQLISDNHLTFHYFSDAVPSNDGSLNASIQFLEKGWQRPDGKEVSREHFLLALADVKAILIKATYTTATQVASLESASIDTAEPSGDGPPALHVEQCVCPTGYMGTSCEDCAPGYTRSSNGIYLEHCGLCSCNGHSNMCHPETGVCYNCNDNTDGENCEICKSGYERNEYGDCVPSQGISTSSPGCGCDSRGEAAPCDNRGYCSCKQNAEGQYCDRCRPGTFGLDGDNPLGCLPCYCSGVTTECHEASHYTRIPMAAPIFGDNYGGYSLTDLNSEQVINDQFVPAPNESELMYMFSFPPRDELYWSLPVFPGNRVLSYGGSLSLTQRFESGSRLEVFRPADDVILVGDTISLVWTNPHQIRDGEAFTYQVPLRESGWRVLNSATPASRNDFMAVLRDLKRVLVRATLAPNLISTAIADVSMDTATESYDPDFPAAKGVEICMCPKGHKGTSCEVCEPGYYKDQFNFCRQCNCNGHECQLNAYDEVICNCRPPYAGPDCSSLEGDSRLNGTNRPPPPEPTVVVRITSPTIKIQEIGSSVNFTCLAQSRMTRGRLPVTWNKVDGYLPQGRSQVNPRTGVLIITNLQLSDSGKYVCQTNDGVSTDQAIATLKVPGNEMSKPTVSIQPPAVESYEGDRVQLECRADGNPAPRVSWQRVSERPLPIGSEGFDELFIIENAREEDTDEYRCIASNAAGSSYETVFVSIRPRPSQPSRDRLTISPTASSISEGQSTRIVCTGSTNVPAGTIDWIRQDGIDFLSNVRSDNGVLYIDVARPENQGVYICQATNSEVAPVPVLVTITPLVPPVNGGAPNITVSVDHVKIPQGGSGSVDCNPTGYPIPLIKWKKYQAEFGPGTSQREHTLILSNAQEEDQGYYLCEGSVNGSPVANIYVYVEIEKREPPRVEIWPQGEQAVALGSEYELHCRVLGGVPEPDVMWDRAGGRQLSSFAQLLPHNVLKFEKVEVNDEGEYTCSATNLAGTASASTLLKVRSPPEIIITPSSYVQAVHGDSVNIECRASGYPEPQVSIRTNPDLREVVAQSPGIAVLRIPSISDRDEGDYVCTAESPAGIIEEQFVIRVDRGDGGDGGLVDGGGSGDGEINTNPNNLGEPASLIAFEGEDRSIKCNASDGFEVVWRRMDQPLPSNAYQSGESLVIRNASKSDTGYYECTVINRYTNEAQQAAYTILQVVAAPRITLRPKTQTVRPGQSPTVECVVDGDDIIDINWVYPSGRRPSSRVETRRSTLIFHQIEVEDAGHYICLARTRYTNVTAEAEVIVSGAPEEGPSLVSIEQPRRAFSVGENVEILCRANARGTRVTWEKFTNQQQQFVETRTYGDGSLLVVPGVEESDAGVYRCTGRDIYGRTSYEDFNLEVMPVALNPSRPMNDQEVYTAFLGSSVAMPCRHNLEEPVAIEWRKEYALLPSEVRPDQPILQLDRVTEADAGTYVCRVSNSRAAVEARAILRVEGVVPRFDGQSWLSMPTLKDAYRQFDIEITFKPMDANGLLLYNSQNQGPVGDYLALQLIDGVPQFVLENGAGPVVVSGDRPLALNTWHTIRVSRTSSKITMDVDNTGPFIEESTGQWGILDLYQPLYLGGVPDYDQLPRQLAGTSGFIGCVSILILGREEKNIRVDKIEEHNVNQCDSCSPNLCLNGGVCQEARNERGYLCLCAGGFAGLNCDRTGEACRPGVCGPGKCSDTVDGYKCACPVSYTGRNCDVKQSIEYPAFTGSAFLAFKAPMTSRYFKMSMKIKATPPVTDGIIMYCAESARGYGGFTSLAVHDGRLEFRYDLGDGSAPAVLVANRSLSANEWTDVHVARIGPVVSLKVNLINSYEEKLQSPKRVLYLETPMFVGGVDDSVVLNNNTGVTGGFSGCIKDVTLYGENVDIVNSSVLLDSANVQECSNYDRGDIPEIDNPCSQCRNGGYCTSADAGSCTCPSGFTGLYCESRIPRHAEPCAAQPCRNGATCRVDRTSRLNYTCDCPHGFAGVNCQMPLELLQSVGFNGNGYLELPAALLRYDQLAREPAVIALAFHTVSDGVLLYQRETQAVPEYGDYILLKVDQGRVVFEWDFGGGSAILTITDIYVNDGERHEVIVKLHLDDSVSLTVDRDYYKAGTTPGIHSTLNPDSNIYLGGIPERYNVQRLPGIVGCIEQVELMDSDRGLNLGQVAVAGRNEQRCRESRS